MSRPLKPPMSIRDHIALLRQRGMEVDEAQATQWLSNVSYHRLAAYWHPARRLTADGRREDSFVDGTSFADVAALYEADRKLRSLVLDGMERVEITMRTRIGELLCQSDPLLYRDASRFRPGSDHSRWVATAQSRIKRAQRRDAAIQHYRDNYDANYPFWVLAEVLDFADISRLFDGLPVRDQRTIAEGLQIVLDLSELSKNQQSKAKAVSPLARWLEQLTVVRNTCAHHGRLFNRVHTIVPKLPVVGRNPDLDAVSTDWSRTFGQLTLVQFLSDRLGTGRSRLLPAVIKSFPAVRAVPIRHMGVPDGWQDDNPLWT